MGHTLEQFAAKAHDILAAEPGPAGREKVRALVEEVLSDEAFVARHLGDDVPERKILFDDPQLGFCILAHVYQGARESKPHDHGPTWAIYGQARGETLMNDWALVEPASEAKPGKVRHVRSYPLKPGMAHVYNEGDLHSPRRDGADARSSASRAPTWTRSSGWPTRRSEADHERQSALRRLRHARHGAARPLRAVPRSAVPRPGDPADRGRRPARSAAPSSSTGCPPRWTPRCSSTASAAAAGRATRTPRQPLSGSRLQSTDRLDFAIERNYDPEAQVMGMAIEGIDIAVLYPTTGLSLIARDNLDPQLSLALCQAYNNWIHEFCQLQPRAPQVRRDAAGARRASGLPRAACAACGSWARSGSFIRPNLVNGHYWHSNYWDPLYTLHEELDVDVGLPRGHRAPGTRT